MKLAVLYAALMGMAAMSEAAVTPSKVAAFNRAIKDRRQFGGDDRHFHGGGNFSDFDDHHHDDDNNDSSDSSSDDSSSSDTSDDSSDSSTSSSGSSDSTTCLNSDAVQTGSASDGQADAEEGQSPSATDNANFINFCSGQTLQNGLQQQDASCNGVVMGKIPGVNNMISSVITNPQNGDTIQSNEDFNIDVQTSGLAAGTFTNPDTTYYSAPQDLDGSGNIIGHTHVTVQDTGDEQNPTTALDPTQFVFFKGINDAGNGQGLLSAAVDGGLPAGNYRICTMTSSANHQPVLMPIAQRGAQDDCIRFAVSDNANSGSTDGSSGDGNDADNGNQSDGGDTSNGGSSNDNGGGSGGGTSSDALGGIAAPAVEDTGDSDRPFSVDGNTFTTKSAAVQRACSVQHNDCADAVNSGQMSGVSVGDCDSQLSSCMSDLS